MAHHILARAVAGAALTAAVALASAPAAQAAPAAHAAQAAVRPGGGTAVLGGPISLDDILSLRFVTPTVQDAKRQLSGLVGGLSQAPAPATAVGLGRLLT
ncbi:hypothetical protein [Streptomyces sp. NPDC012746]|uniref:hypothetical protein n=1 Tax=Streptomyces sp. NPDC012746 TaxID=3364845 RepID=UPI0036ABCCC9